MTDYFSIGAKISKYIGGNATRKGLRFNREGLKALAEQDSSLKEVVSDLFEMCKNPQFEVSFKPSSNYPVGRMITRDGDEIITDTPFVISKDKDISKMFAEANGVTKKVVLEKDQIYELMREDNNFAKYLSSLISGKATNENDSIFLHYIWWANGFDIEGCHKLMREYLRKIDNPVLELSVKKKANYTVSAFRLKDGKKVVAQGAYSDGIDKNGKPCKKYHFSTEHNLATGFKTPEFFRRKNEGLLSSKIRQLFDVFSDSSLSERTRVIFRDKFGLAGNKIHTFEEISGNLGLTTERLRQIIYQGKLDLLLRNLTDKTLKIHEKSKIVPKYLTKEEADSFKKLRIRAIDGSQDALEQLEIFLDINEIRAKKAAYNVIHDIPNPPKDDYNPAPIEEIFVINE